MAVKFKLIKEVGKARVGVVIEAAHGIINNPAFMPVGTTTTVKAMTPEAILSTGAENYPLILII